MLCTSSSKTALQALGSRQPYHDDGPLSYLCLANVHDSLILLYRKAFSTTLTGKSWVLGLATAAWACTHLRLLLLWHILAHMYAVLPPTSFLELWIGA